MKLGYIWVVQNRHGRV